MTVREPLPAPDRSRLPGPKGKVGRRPDPLPGPSDAAPARVAALSGEVGRRCQPQPEKMFNVESAERVELCESLLTWVCDDRRGREDPPLPQTAFPGSPRCARRGGRLPRTAVPSHPGPGAGGAGEGWGGRVCTRGRAGGSGVGGGDAGPGRFSPGSEEDFLGLEVLARGRLIMMGCRRHCN